MSTPAITPEVKGLLDPLPVPSNVKADTWDAYYGADTPQAFKQRFDQLALPPSVKAQLWDLKFGNNKMAPPPNAGANTAARLQQAQQMPGAQTARVIAEKTVGKESLDKPSHMLNALGPLGAIAAVPLTGGTSLLPGLAAAFLGGAGGEAVNQTAQTALGTDEAPKNTTDAMLSSLGEGAKQTAMEAGGRVIMKPIDWLLRGLLSKSMAAPLAQDIYKLNKNNGLNLTAPEIASKTLGGKALGAVQQMVGSSGLFGGPIAAAKQEAGQQAGETLITRYMDTIAPPATSQQAGQLLSEGISRGSKLMHREAEQLYPALYADAAKSGAVIDITNLKQGVIKDLQTASRRSITAGVSNLKDADNFTLTPGSVQDIYNNILHAPNQISLEQAQALREGLRDYQPKPDDIFRDRAGATASHYQGQLTQAIKDSLTAHDKVAGTQFGSRFNDITSFYRSGAYVFDRSSVADLQHMAQKSPESLINSIGAGEISKVQAVKKALLGFQNTATPAEAAANKAAYQSFQRKFAEQKLLGIGQGTPADLIGLNDRLNKMGPDMLNEVYSDPAGRQFLHDTRLLGEAFSRVKSLSGSNAMGIASFIRGAEAMLTTGIGLRSPAALPATMSGIAAFEATPPLLTKALYNPTATRFLLKGIAGMAAESQRGLVSGLGKSVAAGSPYLGQGAADIMRAFQIAQTTAEAFPSLTSSSAPAQTKR